MIKAMWIWVLKSFKCQPLIYKLMTILGEAKIDSIFIEGGYAT